MTKRKNVSKFAPPPASPSVKVVSRGQSPAHTLAGCEFAAGLSSPPKQTALINALVPNDGPAPPMESAAIAAAATAMIVPGLEVAGCVGTSDSTPHTENRLSPSSPHPGHSSLASPLAGSDLEEDDVDMFFNLEPEDDVQLSPESSKKRKLEVGEGSSPSHSPI